MKPPLPKADQHETREKMQERMHKLERTGKSCVYPVIVAMTDIIGSYLTTHRSHLSAYSVSKVITAGKSMGSIY